MLEMKLQIAILQNQALQNSVKKAVFQNKLKNKTNTLFQRSHKHRKKVEKKRRKLTRRKQSTSTLYNGKNFNVSIRFYYTSSYFSSSTQKVVFLFLQLITTQKRSNDHIRTKNIRIKHSNINYIHGFYHFYHNFPFERRFISLLILARANALPLAGTLAKS